MNREAMLYDTLDNQKVRCNLCAHRCLIKPGRAGICQVRVNQEGTLITRVYGRVTANHIDPIEKKPLFHFYPGSRALSIATPGCNFRCQFCQNSDISQMVREHHLIMGEEITPANLVAVAQRTRSRTIAYTYTEPTIFFEYAYDIARKATEAGLSNAFVTNGYETPEAIDMIAPYLDAANVDLKSFNDSFYRHVCGATLQPVLDALQKMKQAGIWLEVTTLIIPTYNDSADELRDIARFIARQLGVETPWHVSAFYPTYKLTDAPPTPERTLMRARDIGFEEGLHYVYAGNLPGRGEDTLCPTCGKAVIRRYRYTILENDVREGRCPECDTPIAGMGL